MHGNISHNFQQSLASDRLNTHLPQNCFQNNDLVSFQHSTTHQLPTKLSPKLLGPYSVVYQIENDVTCRNLLTDCITIFHVTRLKLFVDSLETANMLCVIMNNTLSLRWNCIVVIPDPLTRTTIEILFNRVTTTWIPWNKDIFDTMPYKNFCRSHSELYPSIFTLKILSLTQKISHLLLLPLSRLMI